MTTYEIYGRRLASDIALPELTPAAGAADLTFRLGPLDSGDQDWFDIWPMRDGRPWIGGRADPAGYRIRHNERADFLIDRARATITCDVNDCPGDMLRHFLLDQVVPLALSLEALVLHASSVIIEGKLSAFIGPGGAGKSTMAAALGRRGVTLGSDDGLLIRVPDQDADPLTAVPSYPGVRLSRDSAKALAMIAPAVTDDEGDGRPDKRRFRDGLRFAGGPALLSRLYVIDPRPATTLGIEPLPARAALVALVEQSYRLALDDRLALARQLDALTRIARRVPAWRLSFPRAIAGWRDPAQAVLEHLGRARVAVAR